MLAAMSEAIAVAEATPLPKVPLVALQTREAEHRREMAKLRMTVVRYRALLLEHGITPPDSESADLLAMWRSCRSVIRAASECVAMLGTSKELLDESWVDEPWVGHA